MKPPQERICARCEKIFFIQSWKPNIYCSRDCNKNTLENKDAFLKKIEKRVSVLPNGCIEWLGFCNTYGRLQFNGKVDNATRVFWTLKVGSIPDGMYVCHKCDNPKCVNVDHLFLGTPLDNNLDAVKKGRVKGKITEKEAKEIKSSKKNVATLVKEYGLSRSSIYRIKEGSSWRHI